MLIYAAAVFIGIIAGLRTVTAPMVVSWAVRFGWLQIGDWPLDLLRYFSALYAPFILTALALGELVGDKLKSTPSRRMAPLFIGRVLSGAVCGAAICSTVGYGKGAVLGAVGGVIGTLGGYKFRVGLAKVFGNDLPAAFVEDAIAVGGGFLIVATML